MDTTATTSLRPWVSSYPENIRWDDRIDETPVHEQVLAACAKTPHALALDFLGGTTSFGELGKKIIAFAGALQTQFGVTKGTRVALMLPNTPFYPIAYYGVLRAGGTVVNCNPLYTVPELSHITKNAGADILVTLDLQQIFEKGEALLKAGHVKKLVVAHFPNALPLVKKILFSVAKRKDLARPRQSPHAASISYFDDLLSRNDTPTAVAIDARKDIAVQQYTGGTTGIPKGALLTHANISANMSQIDKWGDGLFLPPSKVVAVLPFFHIFAMTVCMNVPLSNGTPVIMLPRFELKALLALLERTRANVLPAVPTLLNAVARADSAKPEQLASLEVAISGGAALPDEVRAAFAKKSKALLAEGYGLTEASPVVCCAALRKTSKPMSIGLPLPGTDIRFVDVDNQSVVGVGENGELQVKGPQVMPGYYDNEDASRDLHGRLAPDRRRRPHGRGRLRLPRRPYQGPHHLLRLQRLSAHHRRSADDPRGSRRGQRHRRARRISRRGPGGLYQAQGRPDRDRSRPQELPFRQAQQDRNAQALHLQGRFAQNADRQALQERAA
ncbi:long-chain fatty acid--CoA ligase [Devosia chinhatensis]|uniref:Long-chain fatty acid--CoA ligase n=1 Tax=Devosia aurantiaca TaxID=2714858 RepID=A0A6M1SRU9_9HYPH|nr:AMP-binding protein [Devosia aurantiaca]NGP19364.1 long-chain fatty acid--CoA ligase [Devosia aurantiaca]